MNAIHWRVSGRHPCGVGRRWASQQITSTASPGAVTCEGCRRTRQYRDQMTTIEGGA